MRYKISEKKDFYIPLYDWYRKEEATMDRSGVTHWSNKTALALNANWINVFPSGKNRAGTKGMAGAFLLDADRIMKYTASGLKEAHKYGIRIMTTAPISEVFPETWLDWGEDVDAVRAVTADGSLTPTYQNGVSHACTFIPAFREKLFAFTDKAAQAGFDGCLYDGNSYGCEPGLYCQCDSCKAAWKTFCTERLGREEPLPVSAQNLAESDVGRAFFLFRIESFAGLLTGLRDSARKYNPDFEVYLNGQMNDAGSAVYLLSGPDVVTSEYGNKIDLGHDSTLHFFAQSEALTDKQLITFIQKYTDQFDNINEYYTTMAEAYAAGGAMCHAETIRSKPLDFYVNDTGIAFSSMIKANQDAYQYSGNIADTAVLFSWQNTTFFELRTLPTCKEVGYTAVREEWEDNGSRRISAALARNGIPFAYLIPEAKPSYEDFSRYRNIVINENELLDRETEAYLERFVKEGGGLLICGSHFADSYPVGDGIRIEKRDFDLLEKWTGTSFAASDDYAVYTMGKGKILVCKKYMRSGSTEGGSKVLDALTDAFAELSLNRQVRIETAPEAGYVETTLRANAEGTELYLHLIRMDVTEDCVTEPYRVSVALPEGSSFVKAVAASPYGENGDVPLNAVVTDGRVVLTGDFHLYSMIRIVLQYQN